MPGKKHKNIEKELNSYHLQIKEMNEIGDDKLYCGYMKAYFSTYNTVNYRPDRMVKGCFDSEINRFRNGDKLPRFLAQHRTDAVIGKVINIYDDEYGAIVEAKFLNTEAGRDMYTAYKAGAMDELSFAFYVTEFDYDEDNVRNVLKVEGIEEISLVTWGMDDKTKPIEISSKDLTIRDAEQALKNKGFSSKQAKIILSEGFKNSLRDEVEEEDRDGLTGEAEQVFINGVNNLLKFLERN